VGGPLDDVNDTFHAAYDAAREKAEDAGPILIVLSDELVRYRAGARRAFAIGPKRFHEVKSVAHAPVAIYAHAIDRAALRDRLRATDDPDETVAAVVAGTLAFLDDDLAGRSPSLERFAQAMGPALLRLTELATKLQLEALAASTDAALADLTAEENAALRVVVTGDHQARARSLAMQYFRKRLAEPAGVEHRVLYGEAVATEDEARALVGKNRLDRRIARAFFGDETRLQRDILGDAAAAELERFVPPPANGAT